MKLPLDFQDPLVRKLGLAAIAVAVVAIVAIKILSPGSQTDQSAATEVSVKIGKVRNMDIHTYVLAYGAVETAPAGAGRPGGGAKLATPAAGIVSVIPVAEGQSVKAGEVVVQLDDRMTAAAMDKATQALTFAQQQFDRQKQLMAIGGTSQKAFQAAQQQLSAAQADLTAARGALAQTRVASPVDGVVARINVNPGQTVDPNTVVAEIVDLSRLIVTANVPAGEATDLKAGQAASISRGDSDAPVAQGVVSFVSPSVDARTDTALVRIALPKNVSLRPGELVRAAIVSDTHHGVLAVPFESVVKVDTTSVIHLVRGENASQKSIAVGPRDGDYVEIRGQDVHAGDTVVTTGAYGLPEETKIKVIP